MCASEAGHKKCHNSEGKCAAFQKSAFCGKRNDETFEFRLASILERERNHASNVTPCYFKSFFFFFTCGDSRQVYVVMVPVVVVVGVVVVVVVGGEMYFLRTLTTL